MTSRNWTFGQQLTAGYLLAALTLLGVALAGYRSTTALVANDTLVTQTQLIRRELLTLVSALKDVETGYRGYIITGEDTYLTPYRAALPTIRTTLGDLRRLDADNPAVLRDLDAMTPLIRAKLAVAEHHINVRRSSGYEAAAKLVQSGEGKTLMDETRAAATAADRELARQIEARETEARSSAQWATTIILWGGVIGVLLVAAIGWYIVTSLTRKIGDAVALVQSSSAELQSAANQQASGSKEQSSAMSEIATTIRELIATSRQIAENARSVANIASDTDSAATQGDDTVEKANGFITGIRRQVDIIVSHMLDLGMNGFAFIRTIRADTALRDIPAILVTSLNAPEDRQRGVDAGAQAYVIKSEFNQVKVLETIRQCLAAA